MSDNKNKRALVIINPKAGKIRIKNQVMDLSKLSISGIEPTICTTSGKGDGTSIVQNKAHDYDFVICRGGDGTFNEILNGIMALPEPKDIGYIPSGTTNDLAKTLGIPNKTQKAIEKIISGTPAPHDIGQINSQRYFSYIASFGAFTGAAYSTSQKAKNQVGRIAYFLNAVNYIREIKPIHSKIIIDGKETEGNFVFGAVSNSVSVGKVLRMDKNTVNLTDGKFEILLIKNPKSLKEWQKTIIAVKTMNYSLCDTISLNQGKHIEFFFDCPIPWTADGEFFGGTDHTVIDVKNKAVRIFR